MPIVENLPLYQHAMSNKYILPAFHFWDFLSLNAICETAQEEHSPVILQFFEPSYKLVGPVDKLLRYVKDYTSDINVPILLNHDHAKSVSVCKQAIDWGFPSVMYDGSSLPFEENVKNTSEVVRYAHDHGAWVEAELGNMPAMEDETADMNNTVYTDPQKAKEFVERTGCDSLAVSVGTAHGGVAADSNLEIDYQRLEDIHHALGDTPIVLHGAAQLYEEYVDEVNSYGGTVQKLKMCTEETIAKAAQYGVAKANMDVDNGLKVTARLRKLFLEEPDVYRCLEYFAIMKDPVKEAVRRKMQFVSLSSGKADSFNLK